MEFSKVFAGLRHENRFSQRKVAADLKISQALLSHYENGLREPKLDFVVRASEYYGVSTDYMLGRTAVKENPMLAGAGFSKGGDGSELADLWVKGNMYSLINAVTVIMNMLISVYGDSAADTAFSYISAILYNLFRFMRLDTDEDFKALVNVPEYKFDLMCESAQRAIELRLADIVHEGGAAGGGCIERLKAGFPSAYGMFLDWLKREDGAVSALNGRG